MLSFENVTHGPPGPASGALLPTAPKSSEEGAGLCQLLVRIMAPELLGRRPYGLNCDVWLGPLGMTPADLCWVGACILSAGLLGSSFSRRAGTSRKGRLGAQHNQNQDGPWHTGTGDCTRQAIQLEGLLCVGLAAGPRNHFVVRPTDRSCWHIETHQRPYPS